MFNVFGRGLQRRLKFYGNQSQLGKNLSGDVPRAGIKPSLRVGTLLEGKNPKTFTLSRSASIKEAMAHLVENKSSASLIMDEKDGVIGLFTARDLLRFINKGVNSKYGNADNVLKRRVEEAMTPADKVVFCSPSDLVSRCREIMFQLRIRHVPVIHNGEVLGIVLSKDLADSAFTVHTAGGKKGFISNVMGRKGLPKGTTVHKQKAEENIKTLLDIEKGVYALPHPYKATESVAANRRQYGAGELATDMDLCEDANFLIEAETFSSGKQVYACVADGVGSWRQFGIDPRLYARALVGNAKHIILTESESRSNAKSLFGGDIGMEAEGGMHPIDIITEAWHATTSQKVLGSSTICIATVDMTHNQLLYSNIGDCGLMVLRHIDSEVAGYMRDRYTPRHMRDHDLRIAYLSPQQLRSFNLPFQLGYTGEGEAIDGSFETPADADSAAIPLLPGDIIILATDGLFDNVDLMEIITIVEEWERQHFPPCDLYPSKGEAIKYRQVQSTDDQSACSTLAKKLVQTAREFSVDSSKDSPFAVLAKENDIMWGGGMPDDTTVAVLRVMKSDSGVAAVEK